MTQKVVKIPVKESLGAEQTNGQPATEPASNAGPSQAGCPEAIDDLEQQIEKYKDLWMRAEAEVENQRKWAERRVHDRVAAERKRLLRAVLPVADNMERALGSEAAEDGLRDGVALTHRELLRLLSAEGVSAMQKVIGEPFDPLYHEAVATVPSPGDEGKIVEQTQAGYLLDGQPLRPARVIVARATTR
jgi:molecular chaperone GrpE